MPLVGRGSREILGAGSTDFHAALRSCCGLAAGLVIPWRVCHPNPNPSCPFIHSGLRIPHAPALASPGECLPCSALLCSALLGLVSCWEILQEPRVRGAVCCLGWVPTLALVHCFSCREGGEGGWAGQGALRGGKPLGGSFPVEFFLSSVVWSLIHLGLQGELGQSQARILGQSREKKRLRAEWSLQGPLWLFWSQVKVGFLPSEQFVLQEPDP